MHLRRHLREWMLTVADISGVIPDRYLHLRTMLLKWKNRKTGVMLDLSSGFLRRGQGEGA